MNAPKIAPHDALIQHRAFLRRLARSLVHDPAEADDIVQDTVVAALASPPRAEGTSRAYVASILRNVLRNRARETARRRDRERRAARPEAGVEIERGLDVQEELVTALRALPEPYRHALYARYYEDLAPRAIAAREGVSVDTIKSRLRRGLELLRSDLDQRHDGDRRAWAGLLGPLLRPARSAGVALWAAAGIVAAAAIAVGLRGLDTQDPGVTAMVLSPRPESTVEALTPEPEVDAAAQDRTPVPPAATAPDRPAGARSWRLEPNLVTKIVSWDPTRTGPICVGVRELPSGRLIRGTFCNGALRNHDFHSDLAPGRYLLQLYWTDDLRERGEEIESTRLTPLDETEVVVGGELTLASLSVPAPAEHGSVVAGRLVHPFPGRAPFERSCVRLTRVADELSQWVRPTPDGGFDFGRVEAGEYEVSVIYVVPGGATTGAVVHRRTITVRAGGDVARPLRIELPESVPVLVNAVDGEGHAPIDATLVVRVEPDGEGEAQVLRTPTGREMWLPAHAQHAWVEAQEHHPLALRLRGASEVEVELVATRPTKARLLHASGAPIADTSFMLVAVDGVELPAPDWRNVRTDAEGFLPSGVLPRAVVTLREVVHEPGAVPQLGRMGRVDLTPADGDAVWAR